MSSRTAVLVVGDDCCFCSACGAGADPEAGFHNVVPARPGVKPTVPCGARFKQVAITASRNGVPDIDRALKVIGERPDLRFDGVVNMERTTNGKWDFFTTRTAADVLGR